MGDVILLSAYLTHRQRVEYIAQVAARLGVPVLLGGPAFNMPGVAPEWSGIPGVTAVFAGEAENAIVALVDRLRQRVPVDAFDGVFTSSTVDHSPGGKQPLDPDHAPGRADAVRELSDFPWDRYPHRIIPVMASRGCGWGRCTFCSDVRTASGRGFRSRSVERVLRGTRNASRALRDEGLHLSRHQTRLRPGFVARPHRRHPAARRGRALDRYRSCRRQPGQWTGSRHARTGAVSTGMTQNSFGLESGSQEVLRRMAKNCTVERNESFARNATATGMSVRATMVLGYPGETSTDLDLSTRFLERNHDYLDRINLCRFKPVPGTRFERMYRRHPERYPDIRVLHWDHSTARAAYVTEFITIDATVWLRAGCCRPSMPSTASGSPTTRHSSTDSCDE